MINDRGGREPLSPRRPSTRTHAPAIMHTGTTARLKAARPPDFRCHAGAAPPCPCMSDLDWRCRAVDMCPNPNFSEGTARRLTLPTYVGAAARRQVERCAPVRSPLRSIIAGQTLYRLRDPRSVLVENPCPFGYPPGALRCCCTAPGAVAFRLIGSARIPRKVAFHTPVALPENLEHADRQTCRYPVGRHSGSTMRL